MRYEIADNGEIYPAWSRDGRALFFAVTVVSGRPTGIYRVQFRAEPSPAVSGEETMIEQYLRLARNPNYDVTTNNDRVLVVLPETQETSLEPVRQRIHVVLNWFEELKERVPVP